MKNMKEHHEHKECRKLLGSLSDYVDGELNEELCTALEQHMLDCEDCRVVVDTLRKTVYLYHKTTETESLPGDIRQRLYKSLNIDDIVEK